MHKHKKRTKIQPRTTNNEVKTYTESQSGATMTRETTHTEQTGGAEYQSYSYSRQTRITN